MSVRFFLDKTREKKRGDGDVTVRCAICIQGKRLTTTAGFSIKPEYWNQNTQRILLSYAGKPVMIGSLTARELNSKLKRIDSFFSEYEDELRRNGQTVGDLKSIYNENFKKQKVETTEEKEELPDDIRKRLSDFLKEQKDKNSWRLATSKSMKSFQKHMTDFFDYKHVTSIDYFNEDGTTYFVDFLREVKFLRNSTIEKYTSRLRYFIRWAENKGYTSIKANFRPKLQKTKKPIVFLDWDELMKLYEFSFPDVGTKLTRVDVHGYEYEKRVGLEKSTLERVRDVFCFCCFTSLRYSDVENLKRSNLFPGYIQITTVKTGDSLKIELNKYAKAILNKYRKENFPYDKVLPVISNQRMNDYLKEMAEIVGFNEAIPVTYYRGSQRVDEVYAKYQLMSTHAGRRTFICNALMLGIAPQIVMKWTGHSDYSAMKPYIEIADKAKEDAMLLFDKQ